MDYAGAGQDSCKGARRGTAIIRRAVGNGTAALATLATRWRLRSEPIRLSYRGRYNRFAERLLQRVHRAPTRAVRSGNGLQLERRKRGHRLGDDALGHARKMESTEHRVQRDLRETVFR